MKINTQKIEESYRRIAREHVECKEWLGKLIYSANSYFEILKPILRKRGISIKDTEMYYTMNCKSALVKITFTKEYGPYRSIKVRNLENEIRAAGIPCPISNFNREITITLYEGVLFGQRR